MCVNNLEPTVRIEIPLRKGCVILDKFKDLGELRKEYPKLWFVKYVFMDPRSEILCDRVGEDSPLVENGYLTFTCKWSNFEEAREFLKAAVPTS